MEIYLMLIGSLFFTSLIVKVCIKEKKRQEILILRIIVILMFLIAVMRSSQVGIDIRGYEEMYNLTSQVDWNNFEYVYFEKGYILLMKVFSKIGFSFQFFLCVVYGFIFFPLYKFIKRYSRNVTLSLLIYICFIFFTFSLSAIRNSIALSICLMSIKYIEKKDIYSFYKAILICLFAMCFHKSAIVFLLIICIGYIGTSYKIINILYFLIPFILILFNKEVYQLGQQLVGKSNEMINTGGEVGINFIIYFASIAFCGLSLFKVNKKRGLNKEIKYCKFNINIISLIAVGYACTLLLIINGSDTMSRIGIYFQIFIILLIPNTLNLYRCKSRTLMVYTLSVFLVGYYYSTVLLPKTYNVVPYIFFWQ